MKKMLLILIALLFNFFHGAAQQSIKDARQQSRHALVYKIAADTAEAYIRQWDINIDQYLPQIPFAVWQNPSYKYELLPPGNYVIITVEQNELVAKYYCKSNVLVMPVNNQNKLQFELRDTLGNTGVQANLWMNGKQLQFDRLTNTFTSGKKKADEAIIKVAAGGDTSFFELSALETVTKSRWNQWWTNLYNRKLIYGIATPVRLVKKMVTTRPAYWFRSRKYYRAAENGYVIFSQPKYKPGDTLRFKAYIINRKGKPLKKQLDLQLSYYSKGQYFNRSLAKLSPVTPGAYIYDYVLGDSLDADLTYTLSFRDKKNNTLMSGRFKIEDYLLNEVATYALRSEKDRYYRKDTLLFFASAKDANGMALMDGKARLYLTVKNISGFYQQSVLVPDTLWQQEKALLVEGDTRFEVPVSILPDADIEIEATVEFRNSNNEIQEKEVSVNVIKNPLVLKAEQKDGYVQAEYFQNGIPVAAIGKLSYDDNSVRDIQFPFREKINPYIEEYSFRIKNEGLTLTASVEIKKTDNVYFNPVQYGDSAGFSLYNPLKAQVNYSLLYGNHVITSGSDTAENITWADRLPEKKIYTLVWNYIWGGKEYKGNNTVAVLSKILNTHIKGAENIYPGQTDTITISVADYKNKPAAGVNLTAVSYNNQFSKDIKVPEPPYRQRYKYRNRVLMDDYEMEAAELTSKKLLGDHRQWRSVFGLDTMLYYKFLFPEDGRMSSAKYTGDFVPQIAIHAVQKGVPQEIYLLYINRELVWYNGVTDRSGYAFSVPPGYVQIAFRLKDKYIEIDSVYAQPYYKHDIVFDLDRLPAKAKIIPRGNSYTYTEQQQLEQQLFRIQNDSKTNNGFIWQHNQLVHLQQQKAHIVGPFQPNDSLQFYKPGNFDLKFVFEPGYEYKLTPKMARLEKKPLFIQKVPVKLPVIRRTTWQLGDTVPPIPVIQYNKTYTPSYLLANDYEYTTKNGFGTISLQLPPDSSFSNAVLYTTDADSNITRIKNHELSRYYNVKPGNYHLVLVTRSLLFLEVGNILVLANTTSCIKLDNPVYQSHHSFAEALHLDQLKQPVVLPDDESTRDTTYTPVITGEPLPYGNASVSGVIMDSEGKSPIPGVTVMIKGYKAGTVTNENGYFIIRNIREGAYVLVISTVGYTSKELSVALENGMLHLEKIEMKPATNALNEVIVTGYGISKKRRSLAYSVATVKEEVITALQGKAAGVQLTETRDVVMRGIPSLNGDAKPLYVINGVLMGELPAGIEMDKMQVSILKGEMAVSLYGSGAANGVIIINTPEYAPKSLREHFRDYAIWQPNLITGEDGKVQFVTTYPDNITSWQTFVVGMDKKKRITKTSVMVKSFKPIMAQLATPQFLIEGDSAVAIGKLINYTTEPISAKTSLTINNNLIRTGTSELRAKGSATEHIALIASGDTVKAQYDLLLGNGYADGELRKIPIYKKGTEEAKGIFNMLDRDTGIVFTPDIHAGKTVVYIQDNPLDVLTDELKYLKEYPYFCMEQTASKLTGLLLEKQIRKALQQPFKEEKQVQQLLSKLQKAQLFNGGWSWWQNGEADVYITNYITRALLLLKEDALVQTNLRNATLYLQHLLPGLRKGELLDALYTLSEAGHVMDYSAYLQKILFDSLTVHQQWLVVAIKQKQQMTYAKEWEVVMSEKIETMLGGIHWGEDSYRWQSNEVATTVLAYKILQRRKGEEDNMQKIIRYFLERRTGGRWRNTVESASICAAILPMILQQQPGYNTKPIVTITGAENITVSKFPYVTTLHDPSAPVQITKRGGGMMYVTAWQQIFNADPKPVTDNFLITSSFEKTGSAITSLQAGEKAVMKITVTALKDAEYVLIEIPVPAGCTYSDKPQSWNGHKEFLKDKLVIFVERMPKGKYEYAIDLEPRYSGKYTINPAKAALMYFATFYGRNEMKEVEIMPGSGMKDH
jgi:hypothetical protein